MAPGGTPFSHRIAAVTRGGMSSGQAGWVGKGLTTARSAAKNINAMAERATRHNMRVVRLLQSGKKRMAHVAPPNLPLQLMRGLLQGPAAEPPTTSPTSRRHAGCRSLPPSVSFLAATPARRSAAAHLKPLTAE